MKFFPFIYGSKKSILIFPTHHVQRLVNIVCVSKHVVKITNNFEKFAIKYFIVEKSKRCILLLTNIFNGMGKIEIIGSETLL